MTLWLTDGWSASDKDQKEYPVSDKDETSTDAVGTHCPNCHSTNLSFDDEAPYVECPFCQWQGTTDVLVSE